MSLRLELFLLMSMAVLLGCSDASSRRDTPSIAKSEIINLPLDVNITEKKTEKKIEKKFDENISLMMKKLEEKQKILELRSNLDEEKLKNSNKELLQELQKLKWDKEVFLEKVEFQSLKEQNSTNNLELKTLEERNRKFMLISILQDESLKYSQKELLKELQKLRWEKELLSEKFELQKIKDEKESYEKKQKQQKELALLQHKSSVEEAKSIYLEHELSMKRSLAEYNRSKVEGEIALLKVQKEKSNYVISPVKYLNNPLSDDNETLTISDRRIELNGVIYEETGRMVSNQINYFNNKDSKKPIFLVIDYSDGGSVLAGSLILKSIESSKAPVYVVLKSHAASMAAVIITVAERSFAYPHATMLHHEIRGYGGYNSFSLTEEKEQYEDMKRAWKVFALPISEKMGIALEKYEELLYEHSSKGNWKEYAPEAQKLKWVNNVVSKIVDQSVLVNPLYQEDTESKGNDEYEGKLSNKGKKKHYLPKLRPTDMYFIYNPSGYYEMR